MVSVVCDDKENPPYLTAPVTGGRNPKPGAIIEFIELMESNLRLKVELARTPLAKTVDAGLERRDIAFCLPWSKDAAENVVFPQKGGKPDESFSLYSTTFSLYRASGSGLSWDPDAKRLSGLPDGKKIGHTFGSEVLGELSSLGLPLKADYSSILSAFIVLSKGELGGVVARETTGDAVLAANPDIARKIEKIAVPILTVPYYVVFSKSFAERNPTLMGKVLDFVKSNKVLYRNIEAWYLKQ